MKIYLAGHDNFDNASITRAMRYPYRLASYHYCSKLPEHDRARLFDLLDDGAETIMDSGLFTFLFGAGKDQKRTVEDLRRYAAKYLADLRAWGWKGEIVECDAQALIGVEATEALREEFFRPSEFRTIYVWHTPDGIDGLTRLAATAARIALSIPELRKKVGANCGPQVLALLRHVRTAGPASVHLLGCTSPAMMAFPAETCDSSSWTYGYRYNYCSIYDRARAVVRHVPAQSAEWAAWVEGCKRAHPEAFAALPAYLPAMSKSSVHYGPLTMASGMAYWALMDKVNQRHTALEAR